MLAVAVIAIGSLQLTRAGYSVDEEFTVFAVRGIQRERPSDPSLGPSLRSRSRVLVCQLAGGIHHRFRTSCVSSHQSRLRRDRVLLVCGLIETAGRSTGGRRVAARDQLGSVLGHRHERPLLRALPRAVPGDAVCDALERLRHCHPRVLLPSDTRARLHARHRSRRWLDDREGGTQTLVVGRLGDRRRSRRRTAGAVRAARAGAVERRHHGAALLPLAGREPLRAARRSPVHDSARRDGDRLDRARQGGRGSSRSCRCRWRR